MTKGENRPVLSCPVDSHGRPIVALLTSIYKAVKLCDFLGILSIRHAHVIIVADKVFFVAEP